MDFNTGTALNSSGVVKLILFASAVLAVGIAATIMLAPGAFFAGYGIEVGDDASLLSELIAPAGVLLAAGLLMLAGVFRSGLVTVSLTTAAVVYLSYGLSRALSMAMHGIPNSGLVSATVIELGIGAVNLLILLRARRTNDSHVSTRRSRMKDNTNDKSAKNELTLVLGGTGKTGRRVAERLKARGVETRIASRSSNPSFDWNDPATWDTALEGVSAAYITYAPDLAIPGATESIRAFVEKAVARGIERLVLLSGRGEEEAQACEQIVQESGVDWTVVRSSWFAQNFSEGEFLGMVLDGAVTLPAAEVAEPFIDINDIADVAVAALTEDGHAGQIYEVTGPRLLTFAEAVSEISEAAGREVRFVQVPRDAFAGAIAESGAPDEIAWLLNYLFETVLDGRNEYPADGVQRALGREPADFSEFVARVASRGTWVSNEIAAA